MLDAVIAVFDLSFKTQEVVRKCTPWVFTFPWF